MANRFVLVSGTSCSGFITSAMQSDETPGRDNSFCGDRRREEL